MYRARENFTSSLSRLPP